MATSGTATFTVLRDELINASMRVAKALREGDVANATQINNGVSALNMLVKNWGTQGLWLWTYQQLQIPMSSSTQSYTIGPSGATVTATRPLRLLDGTFVRHSLTDTPLQMLSRQAYMQITTKGATPAQPNSVYYDANIYTSGIITSPSIGHGTLYVYVPAADNTYTIYANMQRPIYDMSSATDEVDMPQEWFVAMKWALALELVAEYDVPMNHVPFLEKMSERYLQRLAQWNKDQTRIDFGEMRLQEEAAQAAIKTGG